MSRSSHEKNVLTGLSGIQSALQTKSISYTETLTFPGLDFGAAATAIFQAPAGLRARIKAMFLHNITTAVTVAPTIKVGTSGTTDAQLSNITVPVTSAATNAATNNDKVRDLERLFLVGTVSRHAAAAQLFQATTAAGGGGAVANLMIVVEYFS